jgi:hypothetical protein
MREKMREKNRERRVEGMEAVLRVKLEAKKSAVSDSMSSHSRDSREDCSVSRLHCQSQDPLLLYSYSLRDSLYEGISFLYILYILYNKTVVSFYSSSDCMSCLTD